MGRKIRRDDDSSSDDNNEGSGGGDDSTTEDSRTATSSDDNEGPSTTTPSTTSTRATTPAPSPANTTQNQPKSTSINSDDILSTTGGQTVFVTRTDGHTTTITAKAQSTTSRQTNSSGLSSGATAGIAVGVIIPILLVAAILFFLYRRRKASMRKDSGTWTGTSSEMAASGSDNAPTSQNTPPSGEQTLQSLGYGGTAELHNEDKAVETGGRPVYEMSGSTPEYRGHVDEVASPSDAGDLPAYTAMAQKSPTAERRGPDHDVVSPVTDSATYAPGDIISPLDTKIRY